MNSVTPNVTRDVTRDTPRDVSRESHHPVPSRPDPTHISTTYVPAPAVINSPFMHQFPNVRGPMHAPKQHPKTGGEPR